jgi:hypothetical protein
MHCRSHEKNEKDVASKEKKLTRRDVSLTTQRVGLHEPLLDISGSSSQLTKDPEA